MPAAVGVSGGKAVVWFKVLHWANLVGVHKVLLRCMLLCVVGGCSTGWISVEWVVGGMVGLMGGNGAFGRYVALELNGVGVVIVVNCNRGEMRCGVVVGIVVIGIVVVLVFVNILVVIVILSVVVINCSRGEIWASSSRC